MPKIVLNRDVIVAGEHKKAGQIVDLPKGDAAYFVGHKIGVVHRDVTKVNGPLAPLKPAPTNEDDDDASKKGGK